MSGAFKSLVVVEQHVLELLALIAQIVQSLSELQSDAHATSAHAKHFVLLLKSIEQELLDTVRLMAEKGVCIDAESAAAQRNVAALRERVLHIQSELQRSAAAAHASS